MFFRTENIGIDPLDIKIAPLYLLYGSALLQVAIKNSNQMLINADYKTDDDASHDTNENVISDDADEERDENMEEPASDFSTAWEVLDTARLIFEKNDRVGQPERLKNLSNIHSLLSEVSMESGIFFIK